MHKNLTNVIHVTEKLLHSTMAKRNIFLFVLFLPVLGGCGCGPGAGKTGMPYLPLERRPAGALVWNNVKRAGVPMVYRAVYDEALRLEPADSFERMRNIVTGLGEAGYAAVDSQNQMDMVNSETVLRFCETVKTGETGTVTILVPDYSGSLIQYDLKTVKGSVEVVRRYAQYENGVMKNRSTAVYPADVWQYTEEGYLLFGGSYYMADSYVLVMDDEPDHAALRVAPLAEECRELNRRYILPAGYRQTNLFLTDWSEENFNNIDFYDIFDALYVCARGHANPYVMEHNPNAGIVYSVPEEEFESVVMPYFKIEQDTLRLETIYVEQEKAYEYRPRGFYEAGYSDTPYPEVVAYEKRADGTIELTVNAVYPYENTAKAFTHKVVVRPLKDGNFQYVSNRITTPEEAYDTWWYAKRLTMEEWEEIYQ